MLFTSGSAIISMNHEMMVSQCGSVGVAVATSSISRGKTNLAKLAVGCCGNYPKGCLTYMTDSMARVHLSGNLPFLYDDPDDDIVLKPLLMNAFSATEIGTRRCQFTPRCTPIITCNEHVIDSLAKADDRYDTTIIWSQ